MYGTGNWLFTASWCGPCRALKPKVQAWNEEHPASAVMSVDVDDDPAGLVHDYRVGSVPTLVLVREGQEPVSHVGAPAIMKALETLA